MGNSKSSEPVLHCQNTPLIPCCCEAARTLLYLMRAEAPVKTCSAITVPR